MMTVLAWGNETTACSLSKQGCIRKNSQNWKTWCFAGEYRITAISLHFTYSIQVSNMAQGVDSWLLGIHSKNIFVLSWYGMVLEMLFSLQLPLHFLNSNASCQAFCACIETCIREPYLPLIPVQVPRLLRPLHYEVNESCSPLQAAT